MTPVRIAVLLAAVLLVAGCRARLDTAEETDPEALVGPTWTLIYFAWTNGQPVAFSGSTNYTVEFQGDQRLRGRADCNTYTGTFDAIPAGLLTISSLTATEIACASGSAGAAFVSALGQADRFEVDETVLHVFYEGQGALTFRRQ